MLVEKCNFSVSRMARLLEVSRSGFYAWVKRGPSKQAIRCERIEAKISWSTASPTRSRVRPGFWPMCARTAKPCPGKTVATAMRRLGLAGVCPNKWRTTTIVDHVDAYPADATKRRWDGGS